MSVRRRIADVSKASRFIPSSSDPHSGSEGMFSSISGESTNLYLSSMEFLVQFERGSVEAWSGLDPYTAQVEVEEGYAIFFRKKAWNSYGVLNVREAFAKDHPDLVKRVLAVYEKARLWTLANPSEARQILANAAHLPDAVAKKVWERQDFTNSVLGPEQRATIGASGETLKKSQLIDAEVNIDQVVNDLIDPEFFPGRVANK